MPQNYVQIWTFFALFLMILTTFKGFFSGVLEGNSCFISFLMIKWLQQSLSPVWTNVEFRQASLKNHVDFHAHPSPFYFKNIGNFWIQSLHKIDSSIQMFVLDLLIPNCLVFTFICINLCQFVAMQNLIITPNKGKIL